VSHLVKRDIIVIGGSAGGISAVKKIISGLPPDLPAALLVVIHMPPGPSTLANVLSKSGRLPTFEAIQDQPIQRGTIYVAPPDQHLLIDNDRILLWQGPKENRQRPAINALFRSAAVGYGERVVGVILSGIMQDGTTGLWWVRRYGGIVVVQDPSEAEFSEMPETALMYLSPDYVLHLNQMAPLLVQLANGYAPG
jgi:two-component system chemotaxis response regulator CheB